MNLSYIKDDDYISFFEAFFILFKLAIPASLGSVLRRGIDIASYIFVGRLDDYNSTSGAGLSLISGNLLWISYAIGLSGGIETLSSQAFGSKNNYLAGWYYHRAIVIITSLFIFQSVLLWNIDSILISMGQPEIPALIAGKFVKIYLPGIYAACNVELIRRFLGVQGIYNLLLIIQIFTMALHIFWLYFFIFMLNFGVYGTAIASSITNLSTLIITLTYVTVFKDTLRKDSWHCFNKDSFTGILEYLRFGLPSMFMIVLEFLCFEGLIIISGYLSLEEQTACIVLFNVLAAAFMCWTGISIAASNLVGNSLGANKPHKAKTFANATIFLTVILAIIFGTIIVIFRYQVASIFTKHENVKRIVYETFPVITTFIVLDFTQGASAGIIRAMGYQKIAASACLISYWFIGIPSSLVLAFHFDLRLKGIWLGMPIGLIFLWTWFMMIIYRTDWTELAERIAHRIQKEKQDLKQT